MEYNYVEWCIKLARAANVPDNDDATAIFLTAQGNKSQMLKIFLENQPLYDPIPLRSTVGKVKTAFLFNKFGDEAMSRLNAFIEKKTGQKTAEDSTRISILPEEIANILGHFECVELFRAKQNQEIEKLSSRFGMRRFRNTITINKSSADNSAEGMQMSKAERSDSYQLYRSTTSNIRGQEESGNKLDPIDEIAKPKT